MKADAQQLNRADAERFLAALDPDATAFTFQVFDDDKEREKQNQAKYKKKRGTMKGYKSPHARIFNGSLDDYWDTLVDCNARGCGVFVTVNRSDLKGRSTKNIIGIRALFVDLDGSPIEPVLADNVLQGPHIVTESSPAKWHAYYLVDGVKLEDFTPAQRSLAVHFHGDTSVIDLPRVMRLPGFLHRKDRDNPYLTKIVYFDAGMPYEGAGLLAKLAKLAPQKQKPHVGNSDQKQNETQKLNTLALQNLGLWVPKLFPDAIQYNGGYRVSSAALGRDLEEDLGLMPDGIRDFGLRDQLWETREGKRTALDIVMQYGKKDFPAACEWLREQLGLAKATEEGVSLEDFFAYMPAHSYIFAPSRELWPSSSVNSRLGPVPLCHPDGTPVLDEEGEQVVIRANLWLDQNRPVEQMTWAPGLPMLIQDRLISEGGWIERDGVACFNLYRPPTIERGNAAEADRWLDHIYKVFGEDNTKHITKYLGQRVQRPQDKINHALVLGGNQGIGKDTLLEPAKHAVGPWNFSEVSPQHLLGRFNGYLKSVILRVNEARDLGEINRFSFYDHMKAYTAAPPDVLRVDEKNLREHSILNCCGVIITTNYKSNGIYLPADDRRHYVAWSDLSKTDFTDDYWKGLWGWYQNGGIRHVAAYLAELDISDFDPKAPPPKTAAFWTIVDANRAPEDAELADVLDGLQNPDAVTIAQIRDAPKTVGGFIDWLDDRKNRRVIPHRLEACGYVPVRNDAAKDGLWKIKGARQVVYAKADLSIGDRLSAASRLTQSV
jgi:hypothetical protein